jgi:hypothetical protein
MKSRETAARRSELSAEIAELQNQQLKSFAAATFAGWTPEASTAHQKRSDRISVLQHELNLQIPATAHFPNSPR